LSSKVSVLNHQDRVPVDRRKIWTAACRILKTLGYGGYELAVVLVDDREIARLNRRYFRRNRPTNVISFPMMDGTVASLRAKMLGDVVISAETARRNAAEVGKKPEDEVLFLLIHGILHLVGYDHEKFGEERVAMEAKEQELFALLKDSSLRR
jgi:probable rRNA maturation factor